MATIGSLAMKLALDATQWERGIASVARQAEQTGRALGRVLTSPFEAAASAVRTPFAAIEGLLKPVGRLVESIPLVGGALAAIPLTGAGFLAFIQEGIEHTISLYRESEKLGISLEAAAGFERLAGSAGEAMAHGLEHMSRTLGEAIAGSQEARDKFGELHLAWQELAGLAPDDVYRKVADALKALPSEYDQARLAQEIFGRGALEVADKVKQGSAGLDRSIAKSQAAGTAPDMADVAGAIAAKQAFRDLEQSIAGFRDRLAVGLAPLIGGMVDGFNRWIESLGGAKNLADGLVGIFRDYLVPAIGKAGDLVQGLFASMKNFFDHPIRSALPWWLGGTSGESGEKFSDMLSKMTAKLPAPPGGKGKTGPAAFDTKAIDSLNHSLHDQLDALRMGADSWEYLTRNMKDATEAQLAATKAVHDQIEDQREYNELVDRANKIWEETESPVSKFGRNMAELDDMLQKHVITLEQLAKMAEKYYQEFSKGTQVNVASSPAALAGSQSAFSAITKYENAGSDGSRDVQQQIKSAIEQETQAVGRCERHLAEIKGALGNLPIRTAPLTQ